ncbi:unnamed protein product [Clonostachys chloroleuca]|uniref:Asl1-like glycosyl hydrolase catalytic domain-containing protein n=1 Tax=Clonostachys chloroleuca TaxID=1926264 RepID=A0AA35M6S2_9HYPO|nr:unnamed protein product [Clonostachys chloroleuca]
MVNSLLIAPGLLVAAQAASSDKRGLCFVPEPNHPEDNKIWVRAGTSLSWYYNYDSRPSPAYSNLSQEQFEFVPMMWGVDANNLNDTRFLDEIRALIDGGTNITHVLGFNEPDGTAGSGGSNIVPEDAAKAWVANFEPLAELGVKLGLPACTGGWDGLPWLKQFLGNCSQLVSTGGATKNCTWDFLPVHWYDNFEGLSSHIAERRATWPDAEIWITEYAYANKDLAATQSFYNKSIAFFDSEDYIGRYTYFGAFRSDKSNVGPNAVFLNKAGELTDIGSWYLGSSATGLDPQSGESAATSWSRHRGLAPVAAGCFAVLMLAL